MKRVDESSMYPRFMVCARGNGKSMMQLGYLEEMMKKWGKTTSIKNVIFNDPATIVFWDDGTKTVVKADDESFDPEKGLAMAIAKKSLGNQGNYYNEFKKWLPEKKDDSSNPFGNEIFCEKCEHYHSNVSTSLCSKCDNIIPTSTTCYYTPRKK